MRLVPVGGEHLRLDSSLPFGVRDAAGKLLLGAGARIDNPQRLAALQALPLYADELESQEWRRRLGLAMRRVLGRDEPLKALSGVRPEAEAAGPATLPQDDLPEAWEGLCLHLDAALRAAPQRADWLGAVEAVARQARALGRRHPDASLYHLVHTGADNHAQYSARHALLVMLACDGAAGQLGWDEPVRTMLGHAALTMNVAMTALQDLLAASPQAPTAAMRACIDGHAGEGAGWLQAAGADPAWCDAVRWHHGPPEGPPLSEEAGAAQRCAGLLHRADVFTARISARRTRAPGSPLQAAREACLGANGQPDEVGGALLRAVGLYPPGSFVELANGERGIVVARGRRANLPRVASLVGAGGLPLGEPVLRDTVDARFAVRAALAPAQVKVRPDHARILAL
jgi:HD-GYP domain-containing protein (c-di-GMP phosphodiesterase class II)